MSGTGLLAGVCGALLVGGLLLAAHALTTLDPPARPLRLQLRPTVRADRPAVQRQRALWVAAAVAAAVVWLASGWPVGGALTGLAVIVTVVQPRLGLAVPMPRLSPNAQTRWVPLGSRVSSLNPCAEPADG